MSNLLRRGEEEIQLVIGQKPRISEMTTPLLLLNILRHVAETDPILKAISLQKWAVLELHGWFDAIWQNTWSV